MSTETTQYHRGRPGAEGEAPRHVGVRRLSGRGHRSRLEPGPGPGRRVPGPARGPGARRGRRNRQRRDPRRRGRSQRGGQRPDPGTARGRAAGGRAAGDAAGVAAGRRRGPAVRRRRVRHGDVVPGRHVRAVPPGQRRRAGPGVPPGRDHRPAQLDPRRLHRADVRHDEAVRPAAPARRAAAAAVGPRGATSGRCSATGSPTSGPGARPSGSTCSAAPRTSATTSRPTTARRSRSTGPSRTIRSGPPRWTPSSPTWPGAMTSAPGAPPVLQATGAP